MNYGHGRGFNYFIGKVVNINSPYQDGTVQVRAYGIEDDTNAIPDSNLRWYKVLMPVTHAQISGQGGTHGLMVGTQVLCVYMDDAEQIPMVLGVLSSSGIDTSNRNSTSNNPGARSRGANTPS